MQRAFTFVLGALVAAALFGGLVHAAPVAAQVAQPAATPVSGATPRRLWATAAAGGWLAWSSVEGRCTDPNGPAVPRGRNGARVALVAGLIAAVNGGLNVAVATGGPGTGNGVIGGAAALVLGLVALVLGGLVLARSRR